MDLEDFFKIGVMATIILIIASFWKLLSTGEIGTLYYYLLASSFGITFFIYGIITEMEWTD